MRRVNLKQLKRRGNLSINRFFHRCSGIRREGIESLVYVIQRFGTHSQMLHRLLNLLLELLSTFIWMKPLLTKLKPLCFAPASLVLGLLQMPNLQK